MSRTISQQRRICPVVEIVCSACGERYGLTGSVISAVDLIKGIGINAGLIPIEVPGATGYLDTNYAGKVDAALNALAAQDFVYLHVEAPDEASHKGSYGEKIQAIEEFDGNIVGPVLEGLRTLLVRGSTLLDQFLVFGSGTAHAAFVNLRGSLVKGPILRQSFFVALSFSAVRPRTNACRSFRSSPSVGTSDSQPGEAV